MDERRAQIHQEVGRIPRLRLVPTNASPMVAANRAVLAGAVAVTDERRDKDLVWALVYFLEWVRRGNKQ